MNEFYAMNFLNKEDVLNVTRIAEGYGFQTSIEGLRGEVETLRKSVKDSVEMYLGVPSGASLEPYFRDFLKYISACLEKNGNEVSGKYVNESLSEISIMINEFIILDAFRLRYGKLGKSHEGGSILSDGESFSLIRRIERLYRMEIFLQYFEEYENFRIAMNIYTESQKSRPNNSDIVTGNSGAQVIPFPQPIKVVE